MVVPSFFVVWSPYGVPADMKSFSIPLVGFTALLSWERDAIRAGGDADAPSGMLVLGQPCRNKS